MSPLSSLMAILLPHQILNMVGVAQLVEHPVVVRDVAGSSPVAHPIFAENATGKSDNFFADKALT